MFRASVSAIALLLAASASAQTPGAVLTPPSPAAADTHAPLPDPAKNSPTSLTVYFARGSHEIDASSAQVIRQAADLYKSAKPLLMIVTGSSDSVGDPWKNLTLSDNRALAVLHRLVSLGVPVQLFQVLAKGQTDPAIPGPEGEIEPMNRKVVITWK